LGYKYVGAAERLVTPRSRVDGELRDAAWPDVLTALRRDLTEAVRRHGDTALVAVLSPMLACEEAYLLAKYVKSLAPGARLALGRVPVAGEDDLYPKTPAGRPPEKPAFVIRAEKCPNRAGVEAILQELEGAVIEFATVVQEVQSGGVQTLLLTGGYPRPWLSDEEAEILGRLELVVLVDILPSALSGRVSYLLPGAAWAEKDGSYVNHTRLMQTAERAVRPPGEARSEGRIFWELAQRPRLYHAGDVRKQLAAEVPFFAAAQDEISEYGVRLATCSQTR
jgi:NADH-quinone oxidoreductase subunit G